MFPGVRLGHFDSPFENIDDTISHDTISHFFFFMPPAWYVYGESDDDDVAPDGGADVGEDGNQEMVDVEDEVDEVDEVAEEIGDHGSKKETVTD